VTGPSPGREGELLKQSVNAGLKVTVFPELVRELDVANDLKAYFRLKRHFEENRFDVVHTHSSKAGIIGRFAARAAHVPVVVHTVHGQAFHPHEKAYKNKLYILLERLAARRSDRIFAVAQAMIDQCVEARVAPREKYQVVYSGMDLRSFTEAERSPALRAELGIPPSAPVVGMVARLFELKGHDTLIAAARRVLANFPDVVFLLVGDGVLRPKLEAEVARLGMGNHFVFAGLVPPARVPEYVAQMDVLAHLSLREGLPRACVQGLAAAKPVVAHPLDGTPEVVLDGQTGFRAKTGDPISVAECLGRLLADQTLRHRLGEAGQKLVLERFDWHRMADILEAEYQAGLARKEGGTR
jgi:glycosyltransferase involved in cell wall biosynthesis